MEVHGAMKERGALLRLVAGVAFLMAFWAVQSFFWQNEAAAGQGIYFLEPVTGSVNEKLEVSLYIKGEGIQSGAVDVIIDTRYIDPAYMQGNQVESYAGELITTYGAFFYGAAVLDKEYDKARPYLKILRVSFALNQRVNTQGVKAVMKVGIVLKDAPEEGFVLLPVITGQVEGGELMDYSGGGGVVFWKEDGAADLGLSIVSPENEKRYEEEDILLSATAEAQGNITIEWWDAYKIVNKPSGYLLALENDITLQFTQGIHIVYAISRAPDGSVDVKWSVFGVKEDVIVLITGVIGVTVRDDLTGAPILSATVILSQDELLIASCLTDKNGYCEFTGLEGGQYSVEAQKDGYDSAMSAVELPDNEKVTVELGLVPREILPGLYYDYSDALICVYSDTALKHTVKDAVVREYRTSSVCKTKSNGCCYINMLRKGLKTYWVAYKEDDGLYSQIIGPMEIEAATLELDIIASKPVATGLEVTLKRLTAEGEPIANIEAGLKKRSTGEEVIRYTDIRGSARFSPVDNSQYYLNLLFNEHTGPDGTSYEVFDIHPINSLQEGVLNRLTVFGAPDAASLQEKKVVEDVSATQETEGQGEKGLPSITLTVKDLYQNPIKGVKASVRRGGETVSAKYLNSLGEGSFEDLYPGQYDVVVEAGGYQAVSVPVQLTLGDTKGINIPLKQLIPSIVKTWNEGGEYVAQENKVCSDIVINIENPFDLTADMSGLGLSFIRLTNGQELYTGATDADGRFVLNDLANVPVMGLMIINEVASQTAAQGGGEGDTGALNIIDTWKEALEIRPLQPINGMTKEYTFYFSKGATSVTGLASNGANDTASISISVKDDKGLILSRFPVTVEDIRTGETVTKTTDDSGAITFSYSEPARVKITVLDTGYEGVVFEDAIALGFAHSFELKVKPIPISLDAKVNSCESPQTGAQLTLTGNLYITVFSAIDGAPLPNASIEIYDLQGGLVASGLTSNDGAYSLSPIQYGQYVAWISQTTQSNIKNVIIKDIYINSDNVGLEAYLFNQDTNISFFDPDAPKASAAVSKHAPVRLPSVRIEVRDAAGNLLKARAKLIDAEGRAISSRSSAGNGPITIDSMAPATYSIEIESKGFMSLRIKNIKITPATDLYWTVTLPEALKYYEALKGESEPLREIRAIAIKREDFNPASPLYVTTPSDPDIEVSKGEAGRFFLRGIDPGMSYSIAIESAGRYSISSERLRSSAPVEYAFFIMEEEERVENFSYPTGQKFYNTTYYPVVDRFFGEAEGKFFILSFDSRQNGLSVKNSFSINKEYGDFIITKRPPVIKDGGINIDYGQSYLIAIQESPTTIGLYQYDKEAADKVEKIKDIKFPSPISSFESGYNWLAALTQSGLYIYSISCNEDGCSAYLAPPVSLSGKSFMFKGINRLMVIEEGGKTISVDLKDPTVPFVKVEGDIGFVPSGIDVAGAMIGMVKGTKELVSVKDHCGLNRQKDGSGCLEVGKSYEAPDEIKEIKMFSVRGKTFAALLMDDGVDILETTDNIPVLLESYHLDKGLNSITLGKFQYDDEIIPALLISGEDTGYAAPLNDEAEMSSQIQVGMGQVGRYEKEGVYLWQNPGQIFPLKDYNATKVIETTTQGGIFDFVLIDSSGKTLQEFYNISVYELIEGIYYDADLKVYPRTKDGLGIGYRVSPGDEVWIELWLDVTTEGLLGDLYVTGVFLPYNGDISFTFDMSFDGGLPLDVTNMVTGEHYKLTTALWGSMNGVRIPFFKLPEGDYSGTIQFIFSLTVPDGNPELEKDLLAQDTMTLKIQ